MIARAVLLTAERRCRGAGLVVGAVVLALPWAASAQTSELPNLTTVPATGTVVQDTALRNQLEQYFSNSTPTLPNASAPAWTVTPSIRVEQGWTNNATQVGPGKASFITTVAPGLLVNGESAHVKGTLNFAPNVAIYEPETGQTHFGSNGSGDLLFTVVPDTLFVDARGFAYENPYGSGYSPNSVSGLSRNNTVQSFSGAISPYAQHRFDDWGTGEVGGSIARTVQLGYGSTNSGLVNGQSVNEDLTTTQEHAVFTSGEAFGRSTGRALAQGVQYEGSGAMSGAYNYGAGIEFGYGITRQITAILQAGWEDIHYSGVSPVNINDATWAVGGKWSPSPDSQAFLTYGYKYGRYTFTGNGSIAVTQRVRLYGSYSQGITSNTQSLQDSLSVASIDPFGNAVNPVTGAPLLLGNNLYGSTGNGTVYYSTTASAGLSFLFDRDALNVSVNQQKQQGLTGATYAAATQNSNSVFGSISWRHDLTPDISLSTFFQYGTSQNNNSVPSGTIGQQTTRPVSASAMLNRLLNETLSVYLRYTYNNGAYSHYYGAEVQNVSLVAVGLKKTF